MIARNVTPDKGGMTIFRGSHYGEHDAFPKISGVQPYIPKCAMCNAATCALKMHYELADIYIYTDLAD